MEEKEKNNNENSEKQKKKKKVKYIDDGRTIANMNVEGMKWYVPEKYKRAKSELAGLNITKAERRAMIKGALLAILPIVFVYIAVFFLIFLIIHFWLT